MKGPRLKGTITALVTPMRDGAVDEVALRGLVRAQVSAGVDALAPCGTTGEAPTLSADEHLRVIATVVEEAPGLPVMAGCGSYCTRTAVERSRRAKEAGATASLQVSPYYNRPTQEGLARHFLTIADRGDLPVVLYNIPSRCGVALAPETVARLASHPNIVAIKEASGSLQMASELLHRAPHLDVLAGDDSLALPLISVGAVGVVSVASNILPGEMRTLVQAALQGELAEAQARHRRLFPLFRALFLETNPAPCKRALALLGRMTAEVRPPLVETTDDTSRQLRAALETLGLEMAPA